MKNKAKTRLMTVAAFALSALLAVSFLLMPFGDSTESGLMSAYSIIIGIVFWISAIGLVVVQTVLSCQKKKWYCANRIRESRFKKRSGAFSFFENAYAKRADICLAVSVIGLIVSVVLTDGVAYICYVFTATTVFFLIIHCLLNGKNYYWFKNAEKMLNYLENESTKENRKERKAENDKY